MYCKPHATLIGYSCPLGCMQALRDTCQPIEPDPDSTGEGNGHSPSGQVLVSLVNSRVGDLPDTNTCIALTVAGSDSGGGAGIQADLKTFSALGVYGASVITAVTAQNTRRVSHVHTVPADTIRAQMDAVLEDLDVGALKVGMLSSAPVIETVAQALKDFRGYVVLDPVMVAKSGDTLLQDDAVDALRQLLMPRADLVTPNMPEAAILADTDMACSSEQMLDQARILRELGARSVLIKGGHGGTDRCTDWLVGEDGDRIRLDSPRIRTRNTHGTGCTFSSAIAACLARGRSLQDAVRQAHEYLAGAIRAADRCRVGSGHGPVHHFYRVWT